jgi:hypothetical protein
MLNLKTKNAVIKKGIAEATILKLEAVTPTMKSIIIITAIHAKPIKVSILPGIF